MRILHDTTTIHSPPDPRSPRSAPVNPLPAPVRFLAQGRPTAKLKPLLQNKQTHQASKGRNARIGEVTD